MVIKKLFRSKTDVKVSGVCAGLADYFNIDSNIVRVVWIIITALTGFAPGIIIYIACALLLPIDNDIIDN